MTELKTAIKACREAGKIQLKYFRKVDVFHKAKNPRDVLTKADLEAEERIISIIKKKYPDHDILAEESGHHQMDSEHLWVIDPLDGTSHFYKGNPDFCVMIAFVKKEVVQLGVIWFPVTKELLIAQKGKGTTYNGKDIDVSDVSKISDMYVNTQMSSNLDNRKNNFKIYEKLIFKMRNINSATSCCGRLMLHVADGIADFHFRKGVHYWDYAAGILLVQEAGGKVTDMKGNPFTINSNDVVASNGKCHDKILKLIGST